MRIYLAGYYNGKASVYSLSKDDYPYMLESYHYIGGKRLTDTIRADKRKIFLDSGAFSAFTQGSEIKREKYVEYVNTNLDIIEVAANLDDLSRDKEAAAKNTWENQRWLEAHSRIPILPVYHCREDPKWLKNLLDKYEHIALGGMVPESIAWLRGWLDELFTQFLTDKKGLPRVKIHGFGMTTFELMLRYPFYSVDSTSWVLIARYGNILIPIEDQVIKVCISSESPKKHDWDAHYDSMSTANRKRVEKMINDYGFDVEDLRTIYWKRDLFNIKTFKSLCDQPVRPFTRHIASLF